MRKILLGNALICALVIVASCDQLKKSVAEVTPSIISAPEIPPLKTVNLIREHLANHTLLTTYVWLYRTAYVVDGNFFAIIDFPTNARYAHTYQQLLALCPNPVESNFWNDPAAKPFLLYLNRQGKENAIQLARCTKDIAHPHNRTAPKPDAPLLIYPPENADLVSLEKAAAKGSPSFNDAKRALNINDAGLLVNYLLKRPELVSMYDETGRTLLFDANRVDEVLILTTFGAQPNIQRRNGDTILTEVTGNSALKTVKQLVELGANPKYCRLENSFDPKSAEFLMKNGAPISPNALSNAMGNGKYEIAEILYQNGARLDTTEFYKKYDLTFLHQQIKYTLDIKDNDSMLAHYLNIMELNIRYTGDIQAVDKTGLTALQMVEAREGSGKETILKLLRKRIAEDAEKNASINK